MPRPDSNPSPRERDGERIAALRLIRSENVGPVTYRELIGHFGSAAAALAALPELSRSGGFRRPIRLCPRHEAEAELQRVAENGAHLLFVGEPVYPPALAALDAPPPALYAKGELLLLQRPMVAIVGARQCSAAGTQVARLFAAGLGRGGFVIASGLARGIDAAAHTAAIDTGTVAVLAGGLDVVYPPEHAELQGTIAKRGCLVSEMPFGFTPRGQDFPRRNRIVSGLSLGVVIVEAARRSGSLVTARLAAEQGREVFAVPGHPLDPRAEGANKLLKSGATLVTEPNDVLSALTPLTQVPGPARQFLREEATRPVGPPAQVSDPERERIPRSARALANRHRQYCALNRTEHPAVCKSRLSSWRSPGRIERHGSGLVSLTLPSL
ncbi:MAG: DNA-processing protein DprA [Hyphomicrobium sp.]